MIELGGGETHVKSREAVKISGRVGLVGVLTEFDGQINQLAILRKSLAVNGNYTEINEYQRNFSKGAI